MFGLYTRGAESESDKMGKAKGNVTAVKRNRGNVTNTQLADSDP